MGIRLGWSVMAVAAIAACGGTGVIEQTDVGTDASVLPDALEEAQAGDAGADAFELAADWLVPTDLSLDYDAGMQPGDPGYPCSDDNECNSQLCINTPQGKQCTMQCTEECPFDWICVEHAASRPDIVSICVPPFVALCRPCQSNTECNVNGVAAGGVCVAYGPAGSFCGAACDDSTPCPSGYLCGTAVDSTGATGKFCILDGGECPCSQLSMDDNATTACFVENDSGHCSGSRSCSAAGLSPCSAATPTQEECNAADDDCDGKIDEDTGGEECFVANDNGVCVGTQECGDGKLTCNAKEPEKEACDGKDNNCNGGTDEGFPDTDDDGTADCLETDKDGDGVEDYKDNCPYVSNSEQEDFDFDGTGDACDLDDDADLAPDEIDCAPYDPAVHAGADEKCNGTDDDCDSLVDEGFVDSDFDQLTDCIDGDDDNDQTPDAQDCKPLDAKVHPGAPEICNGLDDDCNGLVDEGFPDTDGDKTADCVEGDTDGDGIDDGLDNCPLIPNPGQQNQDGDALGDPCDDDVDGDGIPNTLDNCLTLFNPPQIDLDKDGAGDPCDDDKDGDSVANEADNCPDLFNPSQNDLDKDGIGDKCDDDDDGDALPDATDNCPMTANPDQADTDKDGQGDACEADKDGDLVPDVSDNCPSIPNPSQDDCDNDAAGAACDDDDDGDGAADDADNCLCLSNPAQADQDKDGVGDSCDSDLDGDGIANGLDNCPTVFNPLQEDTDKDGDGDPCDDDKDGDGKSNDSDNCPLVANPSQADFDLDGSGDACDSDDDGDNDPDTMDCAPYAPLIHHGAPEVCDGKDNNCSAGTDEGFPDNDLDGIKDCVDDDDDGDGSADGSDCKPLDPKINPQAAELCDGVDNNCNQLVDEGFGTIDCGLGACHHQVSECTNGKPGLCNPFLGAVPELCDLEDNDCDGTADEGFVLGKPCTAGTGECKADGVTVCSQDGETTVCAAAPPPPSNEVCDNKDNDCDGKTDEDLGSTTCGLGPCLHTVANCIGGLAQVCDPLAGASVEKCNGQDDNCDGKFDELWPALGTACTAGLGECQTAGVYVCKGTLLDVVCDAQPGLPASETCDGLDNDCDGKTDEELGSTTCGLGVCTASVVNCIGGVPQTCTPLPKSTETCDGLDNDCDGKTDEELGASTCGIGTCVNTVVNCVDGVPQTCTPLPKGAETCDGLDNDCDGSTDEEGSVGCANWYKDADLDGYGLAGDFKCLCTTAGQYTATVGGDCLDSDAQINPGKPEICYAADGKDNDCSGKADDNLKIRIVRMGYSDWDDPGAHGNLQAHLQGLGYTVTMEAGQTIGNIPDLSGVDLLWIHAHNSWGLSADERQTLKNYLQAGGMLWTDDCSATTWGSQGPFTSSTMSELNTIFGTSGDYVPNDHALFAAPYNLGGLPTTEWSGENKGLGITLNGELATFLTMNDFGCGLNNEGNGTTNTNSRNIGSNVSLYAARKKCQ